MLDIDGLSYSVNRTVRSYFSIAQAADIKKFNQRLVAITVRYNLNTAKRKYKGTGAGQSQKSRMQV